MNNESKKKFNKKKNYNAKDVETMKNEVKSNENGKTLKNHSLYGNPNWYFTDKELAEQASRFSFRSFIGNGELVGHASLPSICTLALNPSIGGNVKGATAYTAAVNMAARKIYSRLATKSGRASNYAPQDVLTLILAMGEILSISSHMRRALGLAMTYNNRNRDFPSHIIKALGFDPDDLFSNLGIYRVKFNTIINQINKIPIPRNISWFEKAQAIYDNVFMDSPDQMAEIYAFIPATTWIIDESSYEGGTILKTMAACHNSWTANYTIPRVFLSWMNDLSAMIEAVMTSTTFNYIYGDILNLSANENVELLQVGIVPEDYGVVPTYDAEILLHIHNANVLLAKGNGSTTITYDEDLGHITPNNDIYPDPNTNNLIQAPLFGIPHTSSLEPSVAVEVIGSQDIVDFPYGNPDLTERVEATRFSSRLNPYFVKRFAEGEVLSIIAWTLPDHYATAIELWVNGEQTTTLSQVPYRTTTYSAGTATAIAAAVKHSPFRYHPFFYGLNISTGQITAVLGELNYFTRLDMNWCERINELCYQSLFEIR